MKILLIVLVIWLLFIFDITITKTNGKRVTIIEYNGLLWVGLDYYDIHRFNSDDEPMKWFGYKTMIKDDINSNE